MINWIKATQDNIEKYFFDGLCFSREKTNGYYFASLTGYLDCISDAEPSYDCEELRLSVDYSGEINSIVTHFVLGEEFKLILPKETRV